jgi:hypothetical protein
MHIDLDFAQPFPSQPLRERTIIMAADPCAFCGQKIRGYKVDNTDDGKPACTRCYAVYRYLVKYELSGLIRSAMQARDAEVEEDRKAFEASVKDYREPRN